MPSRASPHCNVPLKTFLTFNRVVCLVSCAVGDYISVFMDSLLFPLYLELVSGGVCSDKGFWNGKFAGKVALFPKSLNASVAAAEAGAAGGNRHEWRN